MQINFEASYLSGLKQAYKLLHRYAHLHHA